MTTKELYDALICKPDLHSHPTLHDDILIWHLYQNAYVQAFCHDGDTTIDIVSNSLFSGSVMHWHPNEEDMVDELYNLGKAGNMLVLKKSKLSKLFAKSQASVLKKLKISLTALPKHLKKLQAKKMLTNFLNK